MTPRLISLNFCPSKNLEILSLQYIETSQLWPITHLKNPSKIGFIGNQWGQDISVLQHLPNLQQLVLKSPQSDKQIDLSQIEQLTTLQSLDLSETSDLLDLAPLLKLTNLRTLNLSCCDILINMDAVSELPKLENLYMDEANVEEVTVLSLLILSPKLHQVVLPNRTIRNKPAVISIANAKHINFLESSMSPNLFRGYEYQSK